MNDEQLIKALTKMAFLADRRGDVQQAAVLYGAIKLVNRQRAETERLEKIRADLSIYVAELKEYIDRCERGEEYWVKCLLERPNEAIKEFAERLKEEKYYGGNPLGYGTWVVEVERIDNLVREMERERE